MPLPKSVRTRRDLYIIGLIFVFQICFFAQIGDWNYQFWNFIKLVTLTGFFFICGQSLYTLYLVLCRKAKLGEFAAYLGGILLILILVIAYVSKLL